MIYVLVFLCQVFFTNPEVISPAKTVNIKHLFQKVTDVYLNIESQSLNGQVGTESEELLVAYERLKAVWRQQPNNYVVLTRYLDGFESALLKLHQPTSSLDNEQDGQFLEARSESETRETAVGDPEGPVQPSQVPSSEENIVKREEATGQFNPAGPLDDEANLCIEFEEISSEQKLEQLDQAFVLIKLLRDSLKYCSQGPSYYKQGF